MNYSEPTSQPDPESPPEFVSARARRRRAQRRAYFPSDEEGRAALFTHLARRAYPSYELFVFSVVSGAILGLGYFLDSQATYLRNSCCTVDDTVDRDFPGNHRRFGAILRAD